MHASVPLNAAQDVAVVDHTGYRVEFALPGAGRRPAGSERWASREETVRLITSRGLTDGTDFDLVRMGPGLPLPSRNLLIGWLTEAATREVGVILVRVRVTDRVGDVHERTINLLKGAVRAPPHPNPPLV
ncbi:hypothetical protein ACFWXA_19030 [Streptomyces atroolivaceus]|uniref:hypothetical protein n=1 Tax=Streptomyces atroolivaceus TaxID=66869 RepID=UPI0036528CF1